MPKETWTKCAEAIGRSPGTLTKWRRIPGAPQKPDPEAWLDWMVRAGKGSRTGDLTELDPDTHLPGANPYDKAVKETAFTYQDGVAREKVIAEIIENEKRKIERDIVRKDLVPQDDVQQMVHELNRATKKIFAKIPEMVVKTMPAHTQNKERIRVQKIIEWAVSEVDKIV